MATAEHGVLIESNDGVVWAEFIAEVPNASFIPAFTSVTFGKGLYAATGGGGDIFTSPDRLVWTRHANVNGLNALNDVIFDGTAFLAVGNQSAVYRSVDGNFWARAAGFVDSKNVVGIAQGDGQFVAVGGWELWGRPPESLIATSPGGLVWTVNQTTFNAELRAVHYADGRYVAVGEEAPAKVAGWASILTSADGQGWTRIPGEAYARLYDVTHGGGQWVAVGESGQILRSPDAMTWTAEDSGIVGGVLQSVVYQGGRFQVVGSSGAFVGDGGPVLLSSEDGVTWQSLTRDVGGDLYGVEYATPWFYAFTHKELLLRSATGVAWTPVEHGLEGGNYVSWAYAAEGLTLLGASNPAAVLVSADEGATWRRALVQMFPNAIAHNGEAFVLVGSGGQAATSPDGENWTYHDTGANAELRGVTYAQGTFVAVGGNFGPTPQGLVLTSSDGRDWLKVDLPEPADSLGGVAFGNGRFLAYPLARFDTVLWRSTTEGAWEKIMTKDEDGLPVQLRPYSLRFFDGRFVVCGYGGRLHSSADGEVWRKHDVGVDESLWGLAYNDQVVVLVGEKRLVQTSSLLDEPFIAVGPSPVTHQTRPGTDALSVQLFVLNQGTTELTFAVAAAEAWVSPQPAEGVVGSGRQTVVTLAFNSASLAAGTYRTELRFTGNASNMPLVVPVALQVRSTHEDQPFIEVSDEAIHAATIVSFEAGEQIRVLRDAGAGSLLYHLSGLEPWLAVTPDSGTLATGQAQPLTFSFPGSDRLAPGTYETTVLVAGNAVNSPVFIPVELEVVDRVIQRHESATLVYEFYRDTQQREVRHGFSRSWFEDETTASAGAYVQGKQDGLWVLFYENGLPREERTFAAGIRHGPYRDYYESGRLKEEGVSFEGSRDQRQIIYLDKAPATVASETWWRRGTVVKSIVNEYTGGRLWRTTETEHDAAGRAWARLIQTFGSMPSGEAFLAKEEVFAQEPLSLGLVLHGVQRLFTWDASAARVRQTAHVPYVLGHKEGLERLYYDDGRLKSKSDYQAGQLHGTVELFRTDGSRLSRTAYEAGARHGLDQAYHPNGGVQVKATYQHGTLQGAYREYDATGQLVLSGLY